MADVMHTNTQDTIAAEQKKALVSRYYLLN